MPILAQLDSYDWRSKKITGRFYAVASGRRPIGMPSCRPLGHGLWEVRSNLAGGRIARVIFCIVRGEMVLLHGFEKKTQKTSGQDIELALKRKWEIER